MMDIYSSDGMFLSENYSIDAEYLTVRARKWPMSRGEW